ncbi:EAL domain-containing protein [Nodosilinea sp. FACHB-131]|uniref:bifunctional diguanylate cyclase/phosphodiesterase n=1 Tax=Cyanophyceae TaxID=3028117 RepID=UPI001684280E|nr:bifunctional diguanylate cyclase/phosphodiesterase [Nodosilinea sp. FACHB-131]MBD1877100.1 EAL domain-containing protein [Nodosilinea sp. FACHB-131]
MTQHDPFAPPGWFGRQAMSRWSEWVPGLAASLSVGLGLLVLSAWHTHTTAIIQWPAGSPPTRYNAAILMVLLGLALLSWIRRWRSWALGLSGAVVVLSGLTLVQYLAGINLGIDQLLMHDYITTELYAPSQIDPRAIQTPIHQLFIQVEQPLPGRPSPNATLSFLCLGLAVLGLAIADHKPSSQFPPARLPWIPAVAATLATGVVGSNLIVLLGYLTQLGTAYTWRFLTGVALPTAVVLLGLGLGIVVAVLHRQPHPGQPRWLAGSVGFGVATASLLLWEALISWSSTLRSELSAQLAQQVTNLLLPAANIVLTAGLISALLVAGVLHLYRRSQAQAQKLHRLNDALTQTRSLLDTILESTGDGILVLDADWHIRYFNSRFLRQWAIPLALADEVVRSGATTNFYPFILSQTKDPQAFDAAFQRMMADLNQKTFDRVELIDGRVLERHGRPHRVGDRTVGKVLTYHDVTERHRAEMALRDSEDRYRSVVTALAEGVVLQDANGVIQTCNSRAEEILGLTLDQMQGRTSIDPRWRSIYEDGRPFPNDKHPAMVTLRTGQPNRNVIIGIHKPNGTLTWISVNAEPMVRSGETQPYAVVCSFADITQRRQMEEALFHEKELAQVTLHSIGDAVITTDVAGRVEYCNPVAQSLTGWSQAEAQGRPLDTVFTIIHEETREPAPNPVEIALRENRVVALAKDTVLLSRDGREIGVDDSAAPICDRQGQTVGAVMVFHDVTQSRQLTRQVTWQAIHDPLTGLVNRREFERRLHQAIARAQAHEGSYVLCYLDLDQFKIVNDTCGHNAGDELLRQITNLLQSHIRKTDTLARLGGDEFGVLLYQCALEQALRVAHSLKDAVQDFRFAWAGNTFAIGVSIGVVPINHHSDTLENVLIAADTACYTAKNNGRNRVHTVHLDDQALLQQQEEFRWVARLTQALTDHRFCLFAQLIVPTAPGPAKEYHYEVLLRLRDDTRQMIPPLAFLPAAERYGLMAKIDRWVVSTLFQHWPTLHNQLDSDPTVPTVYAINLSGASLNDDAMVDFLRQQFALYPVPPQQVCFEITETVAIANLSKASDFVRQLRALGCRFALDDFGSGVSSFAYLKTLPVDYLKIDGGFVKNILDDRVDYAMVDAISTIGRVMGLKTIAEYVENSAILDCITAIGVDFAQGYGIGHPQPLVCTYDLE